MYKEVAVLKVDKELMRGSTTMIILSLLNEEDMYGYQIISKLKNYPTLFLTLKKALCILFCTALKIKAV